MNVKELTLIAKELAERVDKLKKESLYLKSKGIIPDWKNELKNLKGDDDNEQH